MLKFKSNKSSAFLYVIRTLYPHLGVYDSLHHFVILKLGLGKYTNVLQAEVHKMSNRLLPRIYQDKFTEFKFKQNLLFKHALKFLKIKVFLFLFIDIFFFCKYYRPMKMIEIDISTVKYTKSKCTLKSLRILFVLFYFFILIDKLILEKP